MTLKLGGKVTRERLVGERLRHCQPLSWPIANETDRSSLCDARARGQVYSISLPYGCAQSRRLSLAAGDRRKAKPCKLGDDDTRLAIILAVAVRDGDAGKRRNGMKGAVRHGGDSPQDRCGRAGEAASMAAKRVPDA